MRGNYSNKYNQYKSMPRLAKMQSNNDIIDNMWIEQEINTPKTLFRSKNKLSMSHVARHSKAMKLKPIRQGVEKTNSIFKDTTYQIRKLQDKDKLLELKNMLRLSQKENDKLKKEISQLRKSYNQVSHVALKQNDYRDLTSVREDFRNTQQDLIDTIEGQKILIDNWKVKYDALESKYSDAIELIASKGFNSSSAIFSQKKYRSEHDKVMNSLRKNPKEEPAPKMDTLKVEERRMSKLTRGSVSAQNTKRNEKSKPTRAPDEIVKAPDIMKGNSSLFALLFRNLSVSDIQKDKISHNINDLSRRICKNMNLSCSEIVIVDPEAVDQMKRIEVK